MPDRGWIATFVSVGILYLLVGAPASAQKRLDPLQFSLGDLAVKGAWIYNDVKAGFAEAQATGKPLLVVFRCVP